MKKRINGKKLLVILLSVGILLQSIQVINTPVTVLGAEKEEDDGFSLYQAESYHDYLGQNQNTLGQGSVVIPALDYEDTCKVGVLQVYSDYEGKPGSSVLFDDVTPITFKCHVDVEGLYAMRFDYYSGNTADLTVRDILIDGELPYNEASEIGFSQLWMDETNEKKYDKNNNEVRSSQIQVPQWTSEYAMDSSGTVAGALQFYFSAGEHTVTLVPQSETMLLHQITLEPKKEVLSYKEVQETYKKNNYKNVSSEANFMIEAETAEAVRSSQTLIPLNDRTTPSVTPYDVNLIRYNSIGAGQWQIPNQWIEWTIEVPETGLYQIGTHYKQNLKSNDVSIRELNIDGELPFKEASSLRFTYSNSWQTAAFGDEQGNPYLFYLTEGIHTIRLNASLGEVENLIQSAQNALNKLNEIYRKIVVVTGAAPDQYANYQLDGAIPGTIEDMKSMAGELKELVVQIEEFNGQGGASTAAINRLISQLEIMTDDTDKVAAQLTMFKDNISAFSTWINNERNQPLQLDSLYIYSPDSKLPAGEKGFFQRVKHYVVQFLWSFFTDYEEIGVTEEKTETELTVWIATGRDQAQVLRQLINDEFTPEHNISVNLQLITASALLPSIVAGNNPDVYIGAPQADPLNLSLRNVVLDLKCFDDYEEVVAERYVPELLVPFTYEEHVYALPDSMDYQMLFVRTDIMEELGVTKQDLQTWDSIFYDVLPKLQTNALSMGVPVLLQSYLTFLHQTGGEVYSEDGKTSNLASAEAISAMETYSELYTQYGLSLSYDFANRFRSGEMPIALASFTSYNQLSVFATDINGLWEMLPVPATSRKDGSLNNSSGCTVTGSFILKNTQSEDASWEFLKWWTSEETMTAYGRGLESISGSAARYNTANVKALENAAWDRNMKGNLLKQLQNIRVYREVPGGYITQRYYDFAFRDIVYKGEQVRENMIEARESINTEIANKRKEYFLD